MLTQGSEPTELRKAHWNASPAFALNNCKNGHLQAIAFEVSGPASDYYIDPLDIEQPMPIRSCMIYYSFSRCLLRHPYLMALGGL